MRELLDPVGKLAVSVPEGTRLYAVGDIHGRKDLLDRLLHLIRCDAEGTASQRRLVVFLGDYIDRGPQAREVVATLAAGPADDPRWSGFHWICLRGNHEDAMLRFLDDVSVGPSWLGNGGLATIQSYSDGSELRSRDFGDLQALLSRCLPAAHRAFLAALPCCHVEGDYFFVHAGVRPGVPLDSQDRQDLLWIRDAFTTASSDHGKMVVHGHSITRGPDVRHNRIGIDTGAFFSGRLTALVAEGASCRFLST